jgi:hypothetical protein
MKMGSEKERERESRLFYVCVCVCTVELELSTAAAAACVLDVCDPFHSTKLLTVGEIETDRQR